MATKPATTVNRGVHTFFVLGKIDGCDHQAFVNGDYPFTGFFRFSKRREVFKSGGKPLKYGVYTPNPREYTPNPIVYLIISSQACINGKNPFLHKNPEKVHSTFCVLFYILCTFYKKYTKSVLCTLFGGVYTPSPHGLYPCELFAKKFKKVLRTFYKKSTFYKKCTVYTFLRCVQAV